MFRIKLITKLIHINEWLIFYPRLRRFYKSVLKTEAPVILDVGSNKGQTIDFFLKHFKNPKIYGFEPNHDLYLRLVEKYNNNNNIVITNCGISDQCGKLILKETVTSETSTFEELNYDSDYLKMKSKVLGIRPDEIIKKSYEVDVITLNDFIRTEKISKIDVIKIETEGHEYKCLLGLFNRSVIKVSYIQLEQHNDDMYSNAASVETIHKLLDTNGYVPLKKINHGFGDFDEVIYAQKNN